MTRSATPGEPETEAGRWLEDNLGVMTVGPDFRDITSAIIAIEAEARADEAEKWSAVFDDEKWGIRKARREAEARAESSADVERLRAALADISKQAAIYRSGSEQDQWTAIGLEMASHALRAALAATASPGPSQDDIEAKVDDIVERYGGALDALASLGLDVDVLGDAILEHMAGKLPYQPNQQCHNKCAGGIAAFYSAALAADRETGR